VQTTAKKVDGGYILNGQKIFITNGARASWVVVFATVDASLGKAGQRAFVVEREHLALHRQSWLKKWAYGRMKRRNLFLKIVLYQKKICLVEKSYMKRVNLNHLASV